MGYKGHKSQWGGKTVPNRSLATGSSGMSSARGLTSSQGKMKTSHGVVPQSGAGHTLRNSSGTKRIGQGCEGFGNGYGAQKKHGPSS